MKKKLIRFVCFFMSCLIFTLSIPFYHVQAATIKNSVDEWLDDEWIPFITYCASKLGYAVDNGAHNLFDWIKKNEVDPIHSLFEDFKAGVSIKGGKVLVSSDAMNALKGMTDAYIDDCGSYYLIDTYSSGSTMFTDQNGADNLWYTRAGDLSAFKLALNISVGDKIFCQFYSGGSYGDHFISPIILYRDCTDLFFVGHPSNSALSIVTSTGGVGRNSAYSLKYSDSSGAEPFSFYKDCGAYDYSNATTVKQLNNKICLLTNNGRKVKVFKTVASLKNYLQGVSTSSIYVTNNYLNYNVSNDNSISVDAGTVEYIFQQGDTFEMDMSKVINNVTSEINNYYVDNGSTMSVDEIQRIIDESLQKLLDSLPTGGGEEPSEPETSTETETETETETGDVSGNDVSGNNVSGNGVDGPQTVSLLQKILDKLSEIKRAIIGNTVVGGLGDLISTGLDKLVDFADSVKDSVVSVVPEVTDMVSDIIDGTEETIGKMVDNVGTNMRPVGDKMKTKFPFSIPWDIAAVVGSMSAAPETPVFEIPIVFERYDIDYTITIDMADFEVISKISRLFLSLTFILFLAKLTIQVVKMEKEL